MKTSNKILVAFYLAILAVALSAMTYVRVNTSEAELLAPIGDVKTENINVPYLDFLEASEGKITLLQGEPKIEIICAKNILSHLERGFENGKYYIHKKRSSKDLLEFEVRVYANDLKKVVLYGNTHLNGEGTLQFDTLDIEAYNGSMVDLNLNIDFIHVRCTNSTKVELKGNANEFASVAHNAAFLDAEKLITKNADISVGNNSHTNIHAVEKLAVSLNNSGQIDYWGNPQVIEQNVEKSAKLNHRGTPQ